MKHTGALAIVATLALAGCSSGSGSSAPTTDWIGTWNAKVMNDTNTANAAKYKPIAKTMCKDLRDGRMTASDLTNMPLSMSDDDNMTPAQMLLFEFAAVKQYCPDQMSKMPIDSSKP